MALKLAKTTDTGSSAEYWRVAPGFTYDVVEQQLTATVVLYVNEAARRAGKRPMNVRLDNDQPHGVSLSGTDADTAVKTGDPRAALYAVLKALPFFSGAEDV